MCHVEVRCVRGITRPRAEGFKYFISRTTPETEVRNLLLLHFQAGSEVFLLWLRSILTLFLIRNIQKTWYRERRKKNFLHLFRSLPSSLPLFLPFVFSSFPLPRPYTHTLFESVLDLFFTQQPFPNIDFFAYIITITRGYNYSIDIFVLPKLFTFLGRCCSPYTLLPFLYFFLTLRVSSAQLS